MSRQSSGFLSLRDDNIPPSPLSSLSLPSISASGSLDSQLNLLEISTRDIPLRQEYEVSLGEIPGISVQGVPEISVQEATRISLEKYEELSGRVSFSGQEQVSNSSPVSSYQLSAGTADAPGAASLSGIPVSSKLSVLVSSASLPFSSKPRVAPPPEPYIPITRLPTEIIEKVFIIFIEHRCPLLCSLYRTGGIPINSEKKGLHANSSLIQRKLQEEHASVRPLLCLSGYFYGIISRLLSHREVYINGIRSFNQLTLFEQRRTGGFFVIKKPPVIESMFRKEGEPYTLEMRQDRRSLRGSPPGVHPYRSTRPMRYRSYDCTGSGTGWRDSRSLDSSWAPAGWDMFPSWLTGGSIESGLYLFDDDADNKIIGNLFSLAIVMRPFDTDVLWI